MYFYEYESNLIPPSTRIFINSCNEDINQTMAHDRIVVFVDASVYKKKKDHKHWRGGFGNIHHGFGTPIQYFAKVITAEAIVIRKVIESKVM